MNKISRVTSAAALTLLLTVAPMAQQPVNADITVYGKKMGSDFRAVKVGSTVMVPLRPIFKALGAEVKYDNGKIIANRGSREVLMRPNDPRASVDGESVQLQTPPRLIGGSTYVPLRFVAKALGDKVSYDATNKTIAIGSEDDPGAANTVTVSQDRISQLKGKLKQLVVGNQGAILKVRNPEGTEETYYRGLDDRNTAPYKANDHGGILGAIGMTTDIGEWVKDLVYGFDELPKPHKKNGVALLGLINSIGTGSSYDAGMEADQLIGGLLVQLVDGTRATDVYTRRQSVLALAVSESAFPEGLEAVLKLYETSDNLWLTFPVQQYFEYHAAELKSRPDFQSVRGRVAAVNSLYTPNILGYLDN